MDIISLIESFPDSVKKNVVDMTDVMMRTGEDALRVRVDHLLTGEEKYVLKQHKNIIGLDCIASHRYAPEIKNSYFYILY